MESPCRPLLPHPTWSRRVVSEEEVVLKKHAPTAYPDVLRQTVTRRIKNKPSHSHRGGERKGKGSPREGGRHTVFADRSGKTSIDHSRVKSAGEWSLGWYSPHRWPQCWRRSHWRGCLRWNGQRHKQGAERGHKVRERGRRKAKGKDSTFLFKFFCVGSSGGWELQWWGMMKKDVRRKRMTAHLIASERKNTRTRKSNKEGFQQNNFHFTSLFFFLFFYKYFFQNFLRLRIFYFFYFWKWKKFWISWFSHWIVNNQYLKSIFVFIIILSTWKGIWRNI